MTIMWCPGDCLTLKDMAELDRLVGTLTSSSRGLGRHRWNSTSTPSFDVITISGGRWSCHLIRSRTSGWMKPTVGVLMYPSTHFALRTDERQNGFYLTIEGSAGDLSLIFRRFLAARPWLSWSLSLTDHASSSLTRASTSRTPRPQLLRMLYSWDGEPGRDAFSPESLSRKAHMIFGRNSEQSEP